MMYTKVTLLDYALHARPNTKWVVETIPYTSFCLYHLNEFPLFLKTLLWQCNRSIRYCHYYVTILHFLCLIVIYFDSFFNKRGLFHNFSKPCYVIFFESIYNIDVCILASFGTSCSTARGSLLVTHKGYYETLNIHLPLMSVVNISHKKNDPKHDLVQISQ